jgi:hypothetical protein
MNADDYATRIDRIIASTIARFPGFVPLPSVEGSLLRSLVYRDETLRFSIFVCADAPIDDSLAVWKVRVTASFTASGSVADVVKTTQTLLTCQDATDYLRGRVSNLTVEIPCEHSEQEDEEDDHDDCED